MTETPHVVEHLSVHAEAAGDPLCLVEDVRFELRPGQILGIVGETGAGKTMTVRALLGLLPKGVFARGTLLLADGQSLDLSNPASVQQRLGRQLTCVLQNPMSMLDPLWRIGPQLREGVTRGGLLSRRAADRRALELLADMGFEDPARIARLYPHQLSGGMAQRVATAMGMMPHPEILVLDEPTSALDANVRIDVLSLARRLAVERRTAMVLISHDLGLVSHFCDEVAVMYSGLIVETGTPHEVTRDPRHPYTAALLRASATFDAEPRQPLAAIGGVPPAPSARPKGCPFAPRCPYVFDRCVEHRPSLRAGPAARHPAACFLADRESDERPVRAIEI